MANEFKIKNGLLVESGDSQITGSLTAPNITGSLFGTASWAINVVNGGGSVTVADEGAAQGTATFFNFTGAGVTATVSSNTASINIPGGAGSTFPFTGSAIISGSLQVTGSVSSTGGFTGSLLGTSSWAQNAVTASYVTGSIFYDGNVALSASYAISSSYSFRATSASFAQTASYGINIVISGSVNNADYIQFNTTASVTDAVGRLYYDNGEGTLKVGLAGGNVVANIGEDLYQYAYNATGAPLTKGQVVYISGSQGNRIAVKLASATAEQGSANTLGFVAEAIGTGGEGWIQTEGVLRKMNTTGLVGGQLIYLSSSAGQYTQTKPVAPLHEVRLGYAERIDASVGSIYVKIDNGYEIDELHNVLDTTTTSSYGDLFVKSGSLWVSSRQLTGSYGLTGSLTVTGGGFTGSLYGTASWAENAITASYVTLAQTASYVTLAQSASYVQQAQSASYVLNAVSSSYAATASSADAFTVRNFLELAPGTDPGTANVSASYFFVTSSADNTEQNLHYRNNGALWETHWLEQVTNTGLVWGGILTFTASLTDTPPNRTQMRITPGAGLIINHNANTGSHGDTTPTYVQFGPITASADFITSSQVTYLLIDENGQLVQQTTKFTPEQYVEKFPLGYIFCLTTSSISSYADARVTTYGQAEQEGEFVRAFGPLKLSGYDITAQSSSLKISIASGQSYRYGGFYTQNPQSPSIYDSTAVATGSLVRVYRDPSVTGGFKAQTNAGLPFTDIDPTKWDDGSGTLQTVSASQWSIQRLFQGVVNGVSYVYYGQNVYDSLALALQSITTDQFVESPTSILALPFIGYVIAKGDTTNLSDTANNRIIQAGLFRNTAGSSGGGGAAAQNLNDLGDVTITGATNGQALVYNSGLWVNGDPANATNAVTASYVLQAVSASFATTASYVQLAQTASYVTLAQTASYVEQAQSASYVLQAVSSSFASTASFVTLAQTASFVTTAQTASYVLQAVSASFASTASFVALAQTASFVTTAQTASYVLQAVSSSFSTNAATASFVVLAQTASFVTTAQTASYVLNAISSSFASTASFVTLAQTASFVTTAQTASYVQTAQTASYVELAQSASYVLQAVSSSFASTASFVALAQTASFVTTAQTASFVTLAQTASYVELAQSASYVLQAVSASFATTASYYQIVTGSSGTDVNIVATPSGSIINIPDASSTARGLVTTGSQTFLGAKTFSGSINTINSNFYVATQQGATSTATFALLGSGIGSNRVFFDGLNVTIPNNQAYSSLLIGNDVQEGTSGTHPLIANVAIKPLDVTNGTATTTNAATLYIEGAAIGTATITNNYALWVDSGSIRFDGDLIMSQSNVIVTGSVISTGGFTGSLLGTSSWANNAVTASFVTTAQTASFVTASNVYGPFGSNSVVSSSYALTASYALNAGAATAITVADEGTAQGTATFFNFTGAGVTANVSSNTASINIPGGSGDTFPYTGSAIISGSLQVTGSISSTGGFTGSLLGTSSWAEYAITASFVTLAQSASYVQQAQTASYVLQAVSASYATAASYSLATKAGAVANTSFSGNPRKATVTFGSAFPNTSYAVTVTGEDSRTWTIESKLAGSFVINANSNTSLNGTTYWIATQYNS